MSSFLPILPPVRERSADGGLPPRDPIPPSADESAGFDEFRIQEPDPRPENRPEPADDPAPAAVDEEEEDDTADDDEDKSSSRARSQHAASSPVAGWHPLLAGPVTTGLPGTAANTSAGPAATLVSNLPTATGATLPKTTAASTATPTASTPSGSPPPGVAIVTADNRPTGAAAASNPAGSPGDVAGAGRAAATAANADANGRPLNTGQEVPAAKPAPGAEKTAEPQPAVTPAVSAMAKMEAQAAGAKHDKEKGSEAGTDAALRGDTMKPAPTLAPRLSLRPSLGGNAGGEGKGAGEFSFAWKGWTQGGGDRTSSTAQFSPVGEHRAAGDLALVTNGSPAPSLARAQGPAPSSATPAARPFPAEPAALLAPIGNAIERLVLHGRDQLSLTVRFQQGGSLSLDLALRDGQIATRIHTDVPGLEAALKSSWHQLAQDWQGRGWKVANPDFGGSNTLSDHSQPHQHGQQAPTRDGGSSGGAWSSSGAGFSGLGRKARSSASGSRAASGRAGLPVSTSTLRPVRGLQTWA